MVYYDNTIAQIIALMFAFVFVIIVCGTMISISNSSARAYRKHNRYDAFEMALLSKLADKQDIDLILEMKKLELDSDKTFKKRLQEQIVKEFFEKEDIVKEKK